MAELLYRREGNRYEPDAMATKDAELGCAVRFALMGLGIEDAEAAGAMAQDKCAEDAELWRAIAEAMGEEEGNG